MSLTTIRVIDELMNPVLGFAPGPQVFPWQAHARGLGGHLVFGLTSELVLEGLDRVARQGFAVAWPTSFRRSYHPHLNTGCEPRRGSAAR